MKDVIEKITLEISFDSEKKAKESLPLLEKSLTNLETFLEIPDTSEIIIIPEIKIHLKDLPEGEFVKILEQELIKKIIAEVQKNASPRNSTKEKNPKLSQNVEQILRKNPSYIIDYVLDLLQNKRRSKREVQKEIIRLINLGSIKDLPLEFAFEILPLLNSQVRRKDFSFYHQIFWQLQKIAIPSQPIQIYYFRSLFHALHKSKIDFINLLYSEIIALDFSVRNEFYQLFVKQQVFNSTPLSFLEEFFQLFRIGKSRKQVEANIHLENLIAREFKHYLSSKIFQSYSFRKKFSDIDTLIELLSIKNALLLRKITFSVGKSKSSRIKIVKMLSDKSFKILLNNVHKNFGDFLFQIIDFFQKIDNQIVENNQDNIALKNTIKEISLEIAIRQERTGLLSETFLDRTIKFYASKNSIDEKLIYLEMRKSVWSTKVLNSRLKTFISVYLDNRQKQDPKFDELISLTISNQTESSVIGRKEGIISEKLDPKAYQSPSKKIGDILEIYKFNGENIFNTIQLYFKLDRLSYNQFLKVLDFPPNLQKKKRTHYFLNELAIFIKERKKDTIQSIDFYRIKNLPKQHKKLIKTFFSSLGNLSIVNVFLSDYNYLQSNQATLWLNTFDQKTKEKVIQQARPKLLVSLIDSLTKHGHLKIKKSTLVEIKSRISSFLLLEIAKDTDNRNIIDSTLDLLIENNLFLPSIKRNDLISSSEILFSTYRNLVHYFFSNEGSFPFWLETAEHSAETIAQAIGELIQFDPKALVQNIDSIPQSQNAVKLIYSLFENDLLFPLLKIIDKSKKTQLHFIAEFALSDKTKSKATIDKIIPFLNDELRYKIGFNFQHLKKFSSEVTNLEINEKKVFYFLNSLFFARNQVELINIAANLKRIEKRKILNISKNFKENIQINLPLDDQIKLLVAFVEDPKVKSLIERKLPRDTKTLNLISNLIFRPGVLGKADLQTLEKRFDLRNKEMVSLFFEYFNRIAETQKSYKRSDKPLDIIGSQIVSNNEKNIFEHTNFRKAIDRSAPKDIAMFLKAHQEANILPQVKKMVSHEVFGEIILHFLGIKSPTENQLLLDIFKQIIKVVKPLKEYPFFIDQFYNLYFVQKQNLESAIEQSLHSVQKRNQKLAATINDAISKTRAFEDFTINEKMSNALAYLIKYNSLNKSQNYTKKQLRTFLSKSIENGAKDVRLLIWKLIQNRTYADRITKLIGNMKSENILHFLHPKLPKIHKDIFQLAKKMNAENKVLTDLNNRGVAKNLLMLWGKFSLNLLYPTKFYGQMLRKNNQKLQDFFLDRHNLAKLNKTEAEWVQKIFDKSANLPGKKSEEKLKQKEENIIFYSSGLVLLWPFLGQFFSRLGLMEKGIFHDIQAQEKACKFLEFIASNQTSFENEKMTTSKIICGLDVDHEILDNSLELSKTDKKICLSLLKGVLKNWEKNSNSSIENFQASFLLRNAIFSEKSNSFELFMDKKPYDVLLNSLPWKINQIILRWMKKQLNVYWI